MLGPFTRLIGDGHTDVKISREVCAHRARSPRTACKKTGKHRAHIGEVGGEMEMTDLH